MKNWTFTLVMTGWLVSSAALCAGGTPFSENAEVGLNGNKGFTTQGVIGPVLAKAKSYPEGSSRDWYLAQSFSLAGNIAEIIRLAQACTLTSNRDAILLKGLGRAKNVQDVIALAKACGYPADKGNILIRGIQKAGNVQDIIALANACPDRFDAEAILGRGSRYAKTAADKDALAQAMVRISSRDLAKTSTETPVVSHQMPPTPVLPPEPVAPREPVQTQVSAPEPAPTEDRVVQEPVVTPISDLQNEGKELVEQLQSQFGVTMNGVWPIASLRAIVRLFSILPARFRQSCKNILRGESDGPYAAIGSLGSPGRVTVYDKTFRYYSHTGVEIIAHEITHNFQGNLDIVDRWRDEISGPSVSSYGNSNPLEDMAESVRFYIFSPAKMKAQFPSRYQFVKDLIMDGVEFTGKELK